MSSPVNSRIIALPNERYAALSEYAYALYEARRERLSAEEAALRLSRRFEIEITPSDVEAAMARLAEKLEKAGERSAPSRLFLFQIPLISQQAVDSAASRLTWVYHRTWAFALLLATALAVAYAIFSGQFTLRMGGAGTEWFWAYALYLVSVCVHEFGHATACRAYGVRPNKIGLTNYFIFPALYSDVSGAWVLDRWRRFVVDLGGTYFQCICFAVNVALGAATHLRAFADANTLIIIGTFFNFNPIMRFDGYWALADALNAPALSTLPPKLLRKIFAARSLHIGWPIGKTIAVLVYGVLEFCAWVYFAGMSVVWLTTKGPAQLVRLIAECVSGNLTRADALMLAITLASLGLTVWGVIRLAQMLARAMRSRRKVLAS